MRSFLGISLGLFVAMIFAVFLTGCAQGPHSRGINIESNNIASGGSSIESTIQTSVQPYSDLNLLP